MQKLSNNKKIINRRKKIMVKSLRDFKLTTKDFLHFLIELVLIVLLVFKIITNKISRSNKINPFISLVGTPSQIADSPSLSLPFKNIKKELANSLSNINNYYLTLSAEHTINFLQGNDTTIIDEQQPLSPETVHRLAEAIREHYKSVKLVMHTSANNCDQQLRNLLSSSDKKNPINQIRQKLSESTYQEILNILNDFDKRQNELEDKLMQEIQQQQLFVQKSKRKYSKFCDISQKETLRLTAGVKLPLDIKAESSAMMTYEKSSGLGLGAEVGIQKANNFISARVTHNVNSNKNIFMIMCSKEYSIPGIPKLFNRAVSVKVEEGFRNSSSTKESDEQTVYRESKFNTNASLKLEILRFGKK